MNLFFIEYTIFRSISEPIRNKPDYNERWNRQDKGIITAWEVGRELAKINKELVEKVKKGELPPLGFKGGHDKKLKNSTFKYGVFHYLAELQGLKEENLDIDFIRDEGLVLTCTKSKMKTIFTADQEKITDI